MEESKAKIFSELASKVHICNKGIDLVWGSDIRTYKNKATAVYEYENAVSMKFADCIIFEDLALSISMHGEAKDSYKIKEIKTTFDNYSQALAFCEKLIAKLGIPKDYRNTETDFWAYWHDKNTVISVYTFEHRVDYWHEFRISNKQG